MKRIERMMDAAKKCAAEIRRHENILVVSHIDADGLTSAAIMCKTLERLGIQYSTRFIKQLDEHILLEIVELKPALVIFTDLGSGMLDKIDASGLNAVVSDHHRPNGSIEFHLNPHLFGINGSSELSGSGTTYILSQALGDNQDLADLAVVGAVGDLQAAKNGMLVGANRFIVTQGIESGVLRYQKDITLFGKQTRPIYKLLQYSSDPYIFGITGNESAAMDFLKNVGILPSGDGRWKRWIDFSDDEKQMLVSALMQHCMDSKMPAYKVKRLIGESYTLLREQEGTEMRDASEYSTLLNATARYGHADVGLAVCMGERDAAYAIAKDLLANHRQNLVDGLNFVKDGGLIETDNFQYFDAGDKIMGTIVGIIAGMCLTNIGNRNLPIIAFADDGDMIKVSARGTQDLIRRGLNLAIAMKTISGKVNGAGGGHDIAAGATIPKDCKDEFIKSLDELIGNQLSG